MIAAVFGTSSATEGFYEHHPVEDMEPEQCQDSKAADFYRKFVLFLQTSRNSKFSLVCYLIATGDASAEGVSMTDVAAEWGVTKAAVSKECVRVCGVLGIAPSRYMRKEETKESFRDSNRRNTKVAA